MRETTNSKRERARVRVYTLYINVRRYYYVYNSIFVMYGRVPTAPSRQHTTRTARTAQHTVK